MVITAVLVALPVRNEATALNVQCLAGNLIQCESSEDSSLSYETGRVSETYLDAHDDLFGPITAIRAPGADIGNGVQLPAGDFLQIAFALQRSSTPQAVLDVLTSGAWQANVHAAALDYGRQHSSDPFVSAPHPPPTNPTPVPEPASLLLFGSGLAGLAIVARRLRRKAR